MWFAKTNKDLTEVTIDESSFDVDGEEYEIVDINMGTVSSKH